MNRKIDLEALYYNAIAETLLNKKPALNTPIGNFAASNISHLMSKAKDPNGNKSEKALIQLDRLVHETQAYLDSKDRLDADYTEYLISRKCIPWQKEYFVDNAKRIAMQSGRRSGKTYGNALKAIKHCLEASDLVGSVYKPRKAVIVGLTKEKVSEQYWQLLKDTVAECHIPTSKIDNADLMIYLGNGATIKLAGNNSKAEREKLRGDEYSLIIIDEAQSQQGLRYLMEAIFEPIAYGRDSQIVLSGTGALILGSYWQEVTDGDQAAKWRHYHNTMQDNPTIANADEVLQQVLSDKGWTEDEPEYQREYLGVNALDNTRTVLPNRKYYEDDDLKNIVWERCVVGVDYGFSDMNAMIPILVSNSGKMYVANDWHANEQGASDIVAKAKEIEQWARSLKIPDVIFIADSSDNSISKDIWRQGVKVQQAYKLDEKAQWSYMKEYMGRGDLLIKKGSYLDIEASKTVWCFNEESKQVIYEIDDSVYHPNGLDAARYALYYAITKLRGKRKFTD